MICLQSLGIKQALAVDKLQLLLSDTQATVLLHCGEIFNFIHLLKDHKICSGTIFTYGGLNFAVIFKKKSFFFWIYIITLVNIVKPQNSQNSENLRPAEMSMIL